jgi:hypothetical protein
MPLDKTAAKDRIRQFDFPGLFTQELGWDWHQASVPITVDGTHFVGKAIAEKRGFVAYECATPAGGAFPNYPTRRAIEREVARQTHEHLLVGAPAGGILAISTRQAGRCSPEI